MTSVRQDNQRRLTSGMVRLTRLYRLEVNRALSSYGISDAQAVPVLHIARFGGGMRQNILAEEIGIRGPSLVRLLDQLCANSLIERRDDTNDRRAKNLHLTPSGAELAARVEAVLIQLRDRLLAKLDDSDLESALRALAALQDALEPDGVSLDKDEA